MSEKTHDEMLAEFFKDKPEIYIKEYGETVREGELFNSNGKWKYTVKLDYSGLSFEHWDLWSKTRRALANATARGISGVVFTKIPDGWTLFVERPWGASQHPVMVRSTPGYGSADETGN